MQKLFCLDGQVADSRYTGISWWHSCFFLPVKIWRGGTRSWSLGRSPFRWTSSADVCAIFSTLGWTVNPLPFMSCGDLGTYVWACIYTRTSGRNCPGWSGTSRPWWRCSKVISFLYLFDVNLPALLFCRRPQRSWARPCCCASKSRKSFGVCTLLRADSNKANIIVQPHLSVHRHEVILFSPLHITPVFLALWNV